jgi:hypothetical protein
LAANRAAEHPLALDDAQMLHLLDADVAHVPWNLFVERADDEVSENSRIIEMASQKPVGSDWPQDLHPVSGVYGVPSMNAVTLAVTNLHAGVGAEGLNCDQIKASEDYDAMFHGTFSTTVPSSKIIPITA